MIRVRFTYEKRGLLCFVPHVELPPLICRALRRAGCSISRTKGFSPKDKVSLGPALPIGVVGLAEPAEVWLERGGVPSVKDVNEHMPQGLRVTHMAEVEESPSLSKLCTAACYRVYPQAFGVMDTLKAFFEEDWTTLGKIEDLRFGPDYVEYIQLDPAKAGLSKLVSLLKEKEIIHGWEDLFMVRLAVGTLKGGRVSPLLGATNLNGE